MRVVDWTLRTAAVLLALVGIGFGIPCLIGIRSVAAGHGVPLVMGYPSYGGGPFERMGIRTTVPLLVAFLLVCVLEVVAAWLLWEGRLTGAFLALGLLVPGAVFWIGFALPYAPMLAAASAIFMAIGWRALS